MKVSCGVLSLCLAGLLASCDDGGAAVDCRPMCEAFKTCDSTYDLDECVAKCGLADGLINGSYAKEINRCAALSCNEINSCMEGALVKCDTSLDSFVGEVCDKVVSCVPDGTLEQCKSTLLEEDAKAVLRCLSGSALDTAAGCIQGGTCATLEQDTAQCIEDELGLIMMSGSDPHCEQVTCSPACATGKVCDESFACIDPKTCTPACKADGTEACNVLTGGCLKLCVNPTCTAAQTCDFTTGTCQDNPTCTPACMAGQYCDTSSGAGECVDIPVCSPACQIYEACIN